VDAALEHGGIPKTYRYAQPDETVEEAQMSWPSPPVFEVARRTATERSTKVEVSVRGTVDLEHVVIGFIDPAFEAGAQITLPATLLFRLADGRLEHTELPESRVAGYQVDLFNLAFKNYLQATKRGSLEVKAILVAGLKLIAASEYRIQEEEVVVRL
jgi:hypothetical protein